LLPGFIPAAGPGAFSNHLKEGWAVTFGFTVTMIVVSHLIIGVAIYLAGRKNKKANVLGYLSLLFITFPTLSGIFGTKHFDMTTYAILIAFIILGVCILKRGFVPKDLAH
jgi:hypothetical protein